MVEIYQSNNSCASVCLLLEEVDLAVKEELSKILEEPSHQAAKLACESEAAPVLKIKVWFVKSSMLQLQHEVPVDIFFAKPKHLLRITALTMSAENMLFSATMECSGIFLDCWSR